MSNVAEHNKVGKEILLGIEQFADNISNSTSEKRNRENYIFKKERTMWD